MNEIEIIKTLILRIKMLLRKVINDSSYSFKKRNELFAMWEELLRFEEKVKKF